MHVALIVGQSNKGRYEEYDAELFNFVLLCQHFYPLIICLYLIVVVMTGNVGSGRGVFSNIVYK